MIANCPVVDWRILDRSEKVETSKENYAEYIARRLGMVIGFPMRTGRSCGAGVSIARGTIERTSLGRR